MTVKEMVTQFANDEGKTEIEVISSLQAAAVAVGDEEMLEKLCELKWEYINGVPYDDGAYDRWNDGKDRQHYQRLEDEEERAAMGY